jgi:hypothetical protein
MPWARSFLRGLVCLVGTEEKKWRGSVSERTFARSARVGEARPAPPRAERDSAAPARAGVERRGSSGNTLGRWWALPELA